MRNEDLHRQVLEWFEKEKRDLPWRRTSDPYAVWVSEVMLQQTQVATVIPYYERWMERFPTVEALAMANDEESLSLWQGLGYYRRCRLLQQGARFVCENGVPQSGDEWRKVPGVGRYTAGAISSIAQAQRAPIVDGNVQRVFARLTGCAAGGSQLENEVWRWAAEMVPTERPGDWNQALMELGACICKPVGPLCERCPLATMCIAKRKGLQSTLPTKATKQPVIGLRETVWIPLHNGSLGLHQIPPSQWWQGMWRFPGAMNEADGDRWRKELGSGDLEHIGSSTYHVTNHKIRMQVCVLETSTKTRNLTWYSRKDLQHLPLPSPQRKALKMAEARISQFELACPEALSR